MTLHKNKFLTTAAAAALVLAVGACSSSSDDDETVSATPPATTTPDPTTPPTPPVLTELETVQADAAKAAEDAGLAAEGAKMASDAALMARENRAVIQTGDLSGGNSGMLAHVAYTHAKDAATAATAAQDAADAAAEATTVAAATRALVMAETARDDAVTAQGMAETQSVAAMMAAAIEVKIDDKTKTVGDTSITVGVDDTRTVTINGATTRTGKEADVTVMSKVVAGIPEVEASDGPPVVAAVPAKPGVDADRPIDIGFVYDSADDSARVALVHSYIGSTTVTAYVNDGNEITFVGDTYDSDNNADTAARPIKAATGTYYLATAIDDNGNIALETTKGTPLHYYETSQTVDGVTTKTKNFLYRTNTATDAAGVVTYTYQPVNTAAGVALPEATEYAHHHYGIWADLKEAAKATGNNAVSELGVGFVAGLSEMTGDDMPNHGDATYSGGWIAHVQVADPDGNGSIGMETGDSTVKADFEKGTVGVDLTGLANLAGTIDGNTFAGDKAPTAVSHASLTADGEFTGSFSGAFFGPKAKEAGGVFAYGSEDNEAGAFRGAFGGVR